MECNEILELQRRYFSSGKTKAYQYRLDALKALRKSLIHYEVEINQALMDDLNKSPFKTYISEYGTSQQQLTHAIRHLKEWMKPIPRAVGINAFPGRAYDMFEPYGTTLIVSPWNYPITLTIVPLIGAIAAGNCCVIKPSELSPNTSTIIKKIVARAFPKEYVTTILGGKEESQQLLE